MNGFTSRFFPGLLIAGLLGMSRAFAEAPAEAPKTFTHIPLEDSDVLNNLVQKAVADFQENQYEPALAKLKEAENRQPNSPMILNLMGAVFTKQKNYDAAEKQFLNALSLDPRFFPAKFNLGEVKFLRQDYSGSLGYFETMKLEFPEEELVDFKIVLSKLMLDREDEAARTIERMRFPGNSPAWYYANAAYYLRKGERGEGMKYVNTARKIFKSQTSLYDESLQDSGLLSKS